MLALPFTYLFCLLFWLPFLCFFLFYCHILFIFSYRIFLSFFSSLSLLSKVYNPFPSYFNHLLPMKIDYSVNRTEVEDRIIIF